jgi:hypothetical protein
MKVESRNVFDVFSGALPSLLFYSPLSTLYSPLSTLQSLLSSLYSPLSTLQSLLSSLYSPLSTLHSLLSTLGGGCRRQTWDYCDWNGGTAVPIAVPPGRQPVWRNSRNGAMMCHDVLIQCLAHTGEALPGPSSHLKPLSSLQQDICDRISRLR